jgi:hypothetical protein
MATGWRSQRANRGTLPGAVGLSEDTRSDGSVESLWRDPEQLPIVTSPPQQLQSLAWTATATAAPPPYLIALSIRLEIAGRKRKRPGQYRGPPFTGVGHRAAGVGSILADPLTEGSASIRAPVVSTDLQESGLWLWQGEAPPTSALPRPKSRDQGIPVGAGSVGWKAAIDPDSRLAPPHWAPAYIPRISPSGLRSSLTVVVVASTNKRNGHLSPSSRCFGPPIGCCRGYYEECLAESPLGQV